MEFANTLQGGHEPQEDNHHHKNIDRKHHNNATTTNANANVHSLNSTEEVTTASTSHALSNSQAATLSDVRGGKVNQETVQVENVATHLRLTPHSMMSRMSNTTESAHSQQYPSAAPTAKALSHSEILGGGKSTIAIRPTIASSGSLSEASNLVTTTTVVNLASITSSQSQSRVSGGGGAMTA